jgi:phosphoglucosamine mutase
MTADVALAIGRAVAVVCRRRAAVRQGRPAVVIGKDTRRSGDMLEAALAAGVCSMGVDALLAGVLPTPGIALLARDLGADAGLVVSASHNPFEDNGVKIFSGEGYKLPDAEEDEIERLVTSETRRGDDATGADVGRVSRIGDAGERYIRFCQGTFPGDLRLGGLRLVLDCANGATCEVAPAVFAGLGAEVAAIHCEPDGTNINDKCGSQHTEDLAERVVATGADLGLAFDGDGDRLIAVDGKGTRLTGDHVMAICARLYRDLGLLRNNRVVATVMSNFGFFAAMRDLGIDAGQSDVGDRRVLEMMRERDAVLGGEESGHVIFLDRHTSGDGIVAALQLLRAVRRYGLPLDALAQVMKVAPQQIVNVEVSHKPPLEEVAPLQEAVRAAEAELGGQGRVLVRYSGTQALCRIMVEGPTAEVTGRLAQALAETARRAIG